LRTLSTGPFEMTLAGEPGYPFAVIVLEGVLLRDTFLRERAATELVGVGDVVDTRPDADDLSLAVRTAYTVHREASLAVLDDRFRRAARRWPGLYDVIHAQLSRQRRRASTHMAILHLPRVEDRILALFSDLADRWGRVGPDGIVVEVALTHDVLGRLVGSRRPTVTLALAELASAGALERRGDGSWLLSPDAVSR
jgi:CRP-like cAMP-binding protein